MNWSLLIIVVVVVVIVVVVVVVVVLVVEFDVVENVLCPLQSGSDTHNIVYRVKRKIYDTIIISNVIYNIQKKRRRNVVYIYIKSKIPLL